MSTKFDPTISLGSLLQIMSLVISIIGGIVVLSNRQEVILQQNREISMQLAKHDEEVKELRGTFVRRDVRDKQDEVWVEKFDQVVAELQAIKARVGLVAGVKDSRGFYR